MSGIVVDTSALVAIFKAEQNAKQLSRALSQATLVIVPATCLVESALLRPIGRGFFDWVQERLQDERFELGEITAPIAELAAQAARNYGKGSGHSAQLNFGDCFSYALAKYRDLPLLYVGDDFSRTPLKAALPR